jgi:predicted RNA binding protein YcfA (HicA-like mRNA interferase family)
MATIDKLRERFLSIPNDFSWDELVKLLGSLGYKEIVGGKSGGSRRKFINPSYGYPIILHKPHPKNIVKQYAIRQIIDLLKSEGLL